MKKAPKYQIIFEIMLSSTSNTRVLNYVRRHIKTEIKMRPFFIATPNPEITLLASKNISFAKIINSADILLPDGVGLAQATRFLDLANPKNKIVRIPVLFVQGLVVGLATFFARDWLYRSLNLIRGRDMFLELVKLANKEQWKVYLLGGEGKVAQDSADFLRKSLRKVKIMFNSGPILDKRGRPVKKQDNLKEKEVVEQINKFKPHLLFVAFGAPKQEIWVNKWLSKLNIGGAMVVGGTFDYISGKAKLPPAWMEKLDLEWLWRLITQPRRVGRILTAFPLFPIKVFWYKMQLSS